MIDARLIAGAAVVGLMGLVVYLADSNGYSRAQVEIRDDLIKHGQAVAKLQAEKQAALEAEAETVQALDIANRRTSDAIKLSEAKNREVGRLEDMVNIALAERNEALADNIRLVDMAAVAGVYIDSVAACKGLPKTDRASIIPEADEVSPTMALADSIKFIAGEYCSCAVMYNGLYKSCEDSLK